MSSHFFKKLYLVIFNFKFIYISFSPFFSIKDLGGLEKGGAVWDEEHGGTERTREGKNCNQNTLYEEQYIFNKRKKIRFLL